MSLHGKGAVGVVAHSAEIGFRLSVGAENARNAQCLTGRRLIWVNIHFSEKIQIVLVADFVQLLLHVPGVEVIGVIFVPKVLGKRFLRVVNGIVRVIGFQPFVPLLGGLIARGTLHAPYGQHRSVLNFTAKNFLGFLPKGHILQVQHVCHRASHQQQRQGNDCRDQPQLLAWQSAGSPLPLPEFPSLRHKAVPHPVQTGQ